MAGKNMQVIEIFRGLDQTIKPFANAKNYNFLAKCENITIKNKAIEKILHTKEFTFNISGSGQSNGDFKCSLKGQKIHLEGIGNTLYSISGNTRTILYDQLYATAFLDFTVYQDVIIICNGVNKPLQYDGTALSEIKFNDPNSIWLDARPKGSIVFANRVFYWGNPDDPNVLYIPVPNTYNNFDNTSHTVDAIRINSGNSGEVVGVLPFIEDKLIIYMENSIMSLSGSEPVSLQGNDPFKIRTISSDIGCISKRTIISVATDHYFVSQRGL